MLPSLGLRPDNWSTAILKGCPRQLSRLAIRFFHQTHNFHMLHSSRPLVFKNRGLVTLSLCAFICIHDRLRQAGANEESSDAPAHLIQNC
jgi:hypothetical protein